MRIRKLWEMSWQSALLTRLLVILGLMMVSRVVFCIANYSFFETISGRELCMIFLGGLRFDIAGVTAFNSLLIVLCTLPLRLRHHPYYQFLCNGIYILVNAVCLFLNTIDTGYFPFSQRRITVDFFKTQGIIADNIAVLPEYIQDYWFLALLVIGYVGVLWMVVSSIHVVTPIWSNNWKDTLKWHFKETFRLIFAVLCMILSIRGGLQSRPLQITNASAYTSNMQAISLVTNTPFSIWATLDSSYLERMNYFKDESVMLSYFNAEKTLSHTESFRKLNVVIIILESFSAEYVGALNKHMGPSYVGYTPFLDSVIEQSLVAKAFANGSNSIQSVPSIVAGLPSLMNDAYSTCVYSSNRIHTLANILKEKEYTTAFFHGGRNGTMNFDSFAKLAGFDHYYGKDQYPDQNDFDGCWGIYDGPFLQFFAKELERLNEPFLATIFTLSSHHPYIIEPEWDKQLQGGPLSIHKSIQYVDRMLERFFDVAKTMPWYDNTLFVITADHTASSFYPQYHTKIPHNQIPIIYYRPNGELKDYLQAYPNEKSSTIYTQQADIMMTVLDYLRYTGSVISFGDSLLDAKSDRFGVIYINGLYILRKDGYLLAFDGQKTHALYDLENDAMLTNNLKDSLVATRENLELFLKSLIQQYNQRMIENRLTPKKAIETE